MDFLCLWLKILSTVNLSVVKDLVDIAQGLVIITATVFTARWTFKTFAHKEKLHELKELKRTVELYHYELEKFCGQVRENTEPDDREIEEKMELARTHNKLVALASLNLYTKQEFREKIQKIVGKWIDNDRVRKMQHRTTSSVSEAERTATWQMFNREYEQAKQMIDKEAGRLV